MTNEFEKISSNKVKITFTASADEFEAAVNKAYLKNRNSIAVPGFRKGKAPRKMIENLYGPTVFYEDAADDIMQEAYPAAIEQYDLKVVDRPEADIVKMNHGEDFVFTVEVFVRPDVELGEYKGLTVEVEPKHVVTDEEIAARIEDDRKQAASESDVTEGTVENGDKVNLDYAGTADGAAFDGGTAQGQSLTIGSHQFIEGFEEQMIGMAIGEEKDLDVTFPAEYHAQELAGKPAVFHVKVNGITRTELPELDDDFGIDKGYDNLDAYKTAVADEMKDRAEKNYDVSVENAIVDKASENATIDIPNGMIEEQIDYIVRDMEMRMQYSGLRMEDFLKYTGQTMEAFRGNYRDEAEKRVRNELTLEAIVKTEGIEPTEEEIAKQTEEQAQRLGYKTEDFEKSLTDEQRGYLKESAAIQKAIDMMKSTAEIKDKAEEKPEEKSAEEKTEE